MLRGTTMTIVGLMILSGLVLYAQDTSVNVNSFTAYELRDLPVIDGDLSDSCWTNLPDILVDKLGDAPASKVPGDLDVISKAAWDRETNCLYFAVRIIDESFINVAGYGSPVSTDGWRNERFEIMLDGMNTGKESSTLKSCFHQEYCFDLPNTYDVNDPKNGKYGMKDVPVTTSFTPVRVYEGATYKVVPPVFPFNVHDDYLESAARIRSTDPDATEWTGAPVEFHIEIKLAVFNKLCEVSRRVYNFKDPEHVENDYYGYFQLDVHERRELKEKDVIGISLQMCDADVYKLPPDRQHQNTTTGYAGNWNSSENLSGLILGPSVSATEEFQLYR